LFFLAFDYKENLSLENNDIDLQLKP